jgi:poly(hydroxyalkanoate) depolymerase family esterase
VFFWINELARAARQSPFGCKVAAAKHWLQGVLRQQRTSPTREPATPGHTDNPHTSSANVAADTGFADLALLEPSVTPEAPTALLAPVAPEVVQKSHRASFTRHVFYFEGEAYSYALFEPSSPLLSQPPVLPLLVMLHGCKQDADDFARGTDMNRHAAQSPCWVLYPEQLLKANPMRCWNWFDSAHQSRHAGEPAMLAALTRQVIARCPIDSTRVYIAGLSAGGAMAAIVAACNPDLFAAVGVHSGLAPGAAHDVLSAFSAMRKGGRPNPARDFATLKEVMPTLVFHGSADRTVHPNNGDQIVLAAIAALKASGVTLTRSVIAQPLPASSGDLRHTLRTVYSADDQRHFVELWSVQAGPHAWSGGSPEGSYTDPIGPDASAAMLAFFSQHQR